MSKLFLLVGALSAALAVILGAFGAHGLRSRLPVNLLNTFETGVQYQMYHALALMLVGVLLHIYPPSNLLKWSGILFILGSLLFSGSLYALVLTQIKIFGPITPLGGVALIFGWLLLAYAVVRAG